MTSLYRLMLLLLLMWCPLLLLLLLLLIDTTPDTRCTDPESSQIALGAGQSVLLMQQSRVLVLDGQEDEGACNEVANKSQTSAMQHCEKLVSKMLEKLEYLIIELMPANKDVASSIGLNWLILSKDGNVCKPNVRIMQCSCSLLK